jgi:hypothetical protein
MLHRIAQKTTGSGGSKRGGSRAKWSWLEWVAGAVLLGLLVALLLPVLNFTMAVLGYTHPGSRQFTQNTMKAWGLVFKMYASESKGERWPSLAPVPKIWAPDLSQVYPEYLTDPGLLVSSEHPESDQLIETARNTLAKEGPDYIAAAKLMSESFAYLGYAIRSESEFNTVHQAQLQGRLFNEGGELKTEGERNRVIALREGIERFLFTDIGPPANCLDPTLPVLVDIAGWKHKKSLAAFEGTSVLYMDGHVEFVPLGTFPVVPSVMDILSGLAP